MSIAPVDPRMAQMQSSQQDMQERARQVTSLSKAPLSEQAKEKKLRDACEGFESVFIQKMWEQMRATVPKSKLLPGREEQFWQGMYDQELSKKMTSAGGIGLADMMYEQLSRNLVSASRTTASASAQEKGGFTPTAASLMPTAPATGAAAYAAQQQGAPAVQTAQAARMQGMYAGAAEQPEAPQAQGHAASATSQAAPTAAQPEQEQPTSPIVEQFLSELRTRQNSAQPITPAPGQPVTQPPAQPVAGQHAVQPAGQPGAAAVAQSVMQQAGSRMPAGGVLPPMQPVQRQPRVEQYQPAPGTAQRSVNTPTAPGAPVTPMTTAPQQPQAAQTAGVAPVAPTQPVSAAATPQVEDPTQPQVTHTTFTTNVPPSRSNRKRPPRMARGQALNRNFAQPAAPQAPVAPQQPQGTLTTAAAAPAQTVAQADTPQ